MKKALLGSLAAILALAGCNGKVDRQLHHNLKTLDPSIL